MLQEQCQVLANGSVEFLHSCGLLNSQIVTLEVTVLVTWRRYFSISMKQHISRTVTNFFMGALSLVIG